MGNASRRDHWNNFCRAGSLGNTQNTSAVPSLLSSPSRCFRYFNPEMRPIFSRRNKRQSRTIKPLSAIARSAATTARRYTSSSRNRAKQVPEGATKNPPCRSIEARASWTSPLKNRMPRIWQVEKLQISDTESWSRDCRRRDQFHCGEINAISFDIPRGQLPTHQLCVCTDKEIGQRHAGSAPPARTPAGKLIASVGAATNGCCGYGKIKHGNARSAHILFNFLAAPRTGIQFTQRDRIYCRASIDDRR